MTGLFFMWASCLRCLTAASPLKSNEPANSLIKILNTRVENGLTCFKPQKTVN